MSIQKVERYHGTSEAYVESILETGLKMGGAHPTIAGVLLFYDRDQALEWATMIHGDDARLIAIDPWGIGDVYLGDPDERDLPDGSALALHDIGPQFLSAVPCLTAAAAPQV